MARYNSVRLCGCVKGAPVVKTGSDGLPRSAALILRCCRRVYNDERKLPYSLRPPRKDNITVITRGESTMDEINNHIHENDLVVAEGVLTSRNITERYICSCGNIMSRQATRTFITPIFLMPIEKGASVLERIQSKRSDTEKIIWSEGLTPDTGERAIERCAEISNRATIMGTVVKTPDFYEFDVTKKTAVCELLLAVQRRYRIDGSNEDKDYLHVKVGGKGAYDVYNNVHIGSLILVDGAVQSRTYTQKISCQVCGIEQDIEKSTMEIIADTVEFGRNCTIDEPVNDAGEHEPVFVHAPNRPNMNAFTFEAPMLRFAKKPVDEDGEDEDEMYDEDDEEPDDDIGNSDEEYGNMGGEVVEGGIDFSYLTEALFKPEREEEVE